MSDSTSATAEHAPPVGVPLDYGRLTTNPCSAIGSAQLPSIGFTAATKTRPDGDALGSLCSWDDDTVGASGIHLAVGTQKDLSHGLDDIYAKKSTDAYFVPVEISGYPGVLDSSQDNRKNDCLLDLGVSNTQALIVEYQDYNGATNTCNRVQAAGRAVIATLKGQ